MERLPALAADLVRLGVDVIVTGTNPNTVAVMKATTTIPIVMTNSVNPIGTGLVASWRAPAANVTGLAADTCDEIFGKRLELLKETLPNLSRVGILWNPDVAPQSQPADLDKGGCPGAGNDRLSRPKHAGWTHLNKRSRRW